MPCIAPVVCGAVSQGAHQDGRGHIKECRRALSFPLPQHGLKPHILPALHLSHFMGYVRGVAHVSCDGRSDASGLLTPVLDLISDSNHSLCWPHPDSILSQEQARVSCFLYLRISVTLRTLVGAPLNRIRTALTRRGANASKRTLKQRATGADDECLSG